jgi:hypothetical protein
MHIVECATFGRISMWVAAGAGLTNNDLADLQEWDPPRRKYDYNAETCDRRGLERANEIPSLHARIEHFKDALEIACIDELNLNPK